MSRYCERVYRNEADLDRLKALIARLPSDRHVRLALADGTVLTGIVGEKPVLQVFYGPEGAEGMNALLRLEGDAAGKPDARDMWIDEIMDIERLPDHAAVAAVSSAAQPSRD